MLGRIEKPLPETLFQLNEAGAEMRFEVMAGRDLTPNDGFFVRSHTAPARADAGTWQLRVRGTAVTQPYTLSYDELLALPSVTLTRYLECAANGSAFYGELLGQAAQGAQWRLGGYGNAAWTGVPLAAILDRAGLAATAQEVLPVSLDGLRVRRPLSLEKANQPDTLVVYGMNGEPLPLDHGFPARLLVPGWGGMASIKWLGEIQVNAEESLVEWNAKQYVLIGPDYEPKLPRMGMPFDEGVMKSALCLPWNATLQAGELRLEGHAWSPDGAIARVDVSADDGQTFLPARLLGTPEAKAGVRWAVTVNARPGAHRITPRATDSTGRRQPLNPLSQAWNELGYNFGAVVPHPVLITA